MVKVNVPIDLRLFYGTLKPLQARRIKKNYRGGGLPSYEKFLSLKVAWQRKTVSGNCLQWLEVLLTLVEVGDVKFQHKSFPP